jgi:glycosyltransferase involved in cell wall biosynthesis
MPADPDTRRIPSVFVGIPTKNRPRFVREAIQSVLSQTHPRIRVVVSDNQSVPEAAADVARYVRETADPRLAYFRQPVDRGEYGQGRYLIEECREDYFVMLHDDDRLEPGHLVRAVEVMEADPGLAFFSTRQRVIDEQGAELPEMSAEYDRSEGRGDLAEGRIDNVLELFMRHGGVFSISGAVFRTAAVREAGLVDPDCEGLYPFEYNVFMRQAERGASAYYSTRPLVAYRRHAGTMRNYARPFFNRGMMQTLMRILERRRFSGEPERLRRRLLGAVYRNYAYILYVAGDRGACYRFLGRALRLYPRSPRTWLYALTAITVPFLIPRLWGPRVTLESQHST